MVEMPMAKIRKQFANSVSGGAGVMLDALLPPQCLCCGTMVDRQGNLCAECWSGMVFLEAPCCHVCGFPFPHDEGAGVLCAECTRQQPDYDRARAVFAYDDNSRQLLLRLKHGDRLDGVPAFGQWLARAGTAFWPDTDVVLPIPLHPWRLVRRRYNQAALLARAVSRFCDLPSPPNLLQRSRSTISQGGLTRRGRARNVRGAFAVRKSGTGILAGAHIVLIDDVFTTGATVSACARLLKRHGAARVDVLTMARVL